MDGADQHEQSFDQLPAVALLEVLKLLPIGDLLTCRLVCKRLGELAMHPTVWQEKSLGWGENHQKLACPVLRLAPCLGRAEDPRSRDDCCVHTLSTTRCAVEHLEIDVDNRGDHDHIGFGWFGSAGNHLLEAALALQRQEVLGRLKSLWITIRLEDTTTGHESTLYRTLALTSRLLETLVVEVIPEARATPGTRCFEGIQVPSSLKRVEFNLRRQETALVDFLLSTHAATLETVLFDEQPVSTSTLQLLAGLPRLRELTCRLQAGLEALAASESLQVLSIWVKGQEEEPAEVTSAASLLRQARQLRQVSLQCNRNAHSHSSQYPAALVKALAGGAGRAHVEKLCVVCRCDGQQQLGRVLLDALPELPALRELDLDCWRRRQPQDGSDRHDRHEPLDESDESYEQLLRGLTPAIAPALRRLTVMACAHEWTHKPSVKALLVANPCLQVRVGWREHIDDPDPDLMKPLSSCRYCYACKVLKCHPELREARYNSHVCFSLKQELSTCPTVHNHSNLSW